MQSGLTESRAGRFETIRMGHWTFSEMRAAFGWNLDTFLMHGGYPGSAGLIADRERWARYILDSLVETTISRDVLMMTRVDKPALLRQLFGLACDYSGQILSFTKMLGQLHDAGNTTTLSHYLELLSQAGMVAGLQRFSGSKVRARASIPKLVALNTALMTARWHEDQSVVRRDGDRWGRLVETAVGAHLVATTDGTGIEVFYWRDGNDEVDFVLRKGKSVVAIEVKSGSGVARRSGLTAFARRFDPVRSVIVGADGIPLEEFLLRGAQGWF